MGGKWEYYNHNKGHKVEIVTVDYRGYCIGINSDKKHWNYLYKDGLIRESSSELGRLDCFWPTLEDAIEFYAIWAKIKTPAPKRKTRCIWY